jgi:hypothetical protein
MVVALAVNTAMVEAAVLAVAVVMATQPPHTMAEQEHQGRVIMEVTTLAITLVLVAVAELDKRVVPLLAAPLVLEEMALPHLFQVHQ